MKWLLKRLREPSTWRGIIWLITACGLTLRPEEAEAVIVAGVALAGVFGVFTADELPPIALQGRAGSAAVRDGDPVGADCGVAVADQDQSGAAARVRPDLSPESETQPSGWNG